MKFLIFKKLSTRFVKRTYIRILKGFQKVLIENLSKLYNRRLKKKMHVFKHFKIYLKLWKISLKLFGKLLNFFWKFKSFSNSLVCISISFLKFLPLIISFRCCCFFKRKKKKSPRQKWLDAQKSPEREAAVTLLRATSHSNSRDSCLNPSQDYIQASSQHNIRYPSASVLTSTPTNNTPTLPI